MGDLLGLFIAIISSRVRFEATNLGKVAAAPVYFSFLELLEETCTLQPIIKITLCWCCHRVTLINNKYKPASLVCSSSQSGSCARVMLAAARLFSRAACFSQPPFHVCTLVMIINRNIKASGAILVCDNPHTLVSTTLTCRCHGNTAYVIMSPHPADMESRCMSTPAYSGYVTCWLL